MATDPDSLSKLRKYAAKVKETDYGLVGANGEEDYEARINRTLQSLQNQVKQHQDALEKLRASATEPAIDEPSLDPETRLRQTRTITAACKSITPTEPLLPLPNSPLPALLALRSSLNLVDQTKTSIREAKAKIDTARARLKQEQNDLQEARSLSQALEKRMEKLKVENEEQSHKSPEDVVNAMVQEQQQQRKHYTTDLRKLVLAFNKFVDSNLSSIIAAEDLGGPVVGDLLNITEETLKAGFNQQGKPKKASLASNTSDAKRKRRNGEVWGPEDEGEDMEPRSEKEAAAADFRTLVEDLLNASAGDEEGKTYVRIWRESAAVRFLVRAKVAHFDPGDARRLRLADFGREFDEE